MSTYISVLLEPRTITVESKVESAGTPESFSSEVTVVGIPDGTPIGSLPWKTRPYSVAEIRREGSHIVAMHYDVDEYGIGETVEEALKDLLISLVDYLSSLEKREKRLGDKERRDLDKLRMLLERR